MLIYDLLLANLQDHLAGFPIERQRLDLKENSR
jgi:hypothetical protein